MISLIVNADDYGLTPAVSEGIRVAHKRGVVTSTSAIMTRECAIREIARAQEEVPTLAFGVHLSVSCGRPVLPPEEVPSLLSADGTFAPPEATGRVHREELRQELRAQIERFLETGVRLTHLNSHQCLLERNLEFFAEELALAKEFKVPVRWFANIVFRNFCAPRNEGGDRALVESYERLLRRIGSLHTDSVLATRIAPGEIERAVSSLSAGIHELMCHPGYVDDALRECDAYVDGRESELRVLTSPWLRECLLESKVTLVDFTAVHSRAEESSGSGALV